ncbi:MAG: pilus assembly protein [Beijerinckiaceae bacterium]|nr:pilus assembly protein [Beijerinckiaceae bacterium]
MDTRRSRNILRDESGATAVEFGMLAAPFVALVLAILQTSTSLLVSQGLDTAVQEAGRMVMTGQVHESGGVASAAAFRDKYICNPDAPNVRMLPNFIDCTKLVVDIRKAAQFASGVPAFDTANPASCIGGAGDVIIVRVLYHAPIFAPFIALNGFVADGTITSGQVNVNGVMTYAMSAATAFRNEPFGGTAPC